MSVVRCSWLASLAPNHKGGGPAQLNAPAFGSPEASVNPLPDPAALEFGHRHEDAELKPSGWVIFARVDALGGAGQRDTHSLKLIEDQGEMSHASAKAVQLVDHRPAAFAGSGLRQQGT